MRHALCERASQTTALQLYKTNARIPWEQLTESHWALHSFESPDARGQRGVGTLLKTIGQYGGHDGGDREASVVPRRDGTSLDGPWVNAGQLPHSREPSYA